MRMYVEDDQLTGIADAIRGKAIAKIGETRVDLDISGIQFIQIRWRRNPQYYTMTNNITYIWSDEDGTQIGNSVSFLAQPDMGEKAIEDRPDGAKYIRITGSPDNGFTEVWGSSLYSFPDGFIAAINSIESASTMPLANGGSF